MTRFTLCFFANATFFESFISFVNSLFFNIKFDEFCKSAPERIHAASPTSETTSKEIGRVKLVKNEPLD